MKHYKGIILFFAVLALFLGAAVLASAQETLKLSGITTTDEHPNGCVDCHTQSGDNDYRLSTELKNLSGHPDVTKIVKTVPKDCAMCHKPNSSAGPLNLQVHKIHFQNPGENHFIEYYQGECLACHSLDLSTGEMSVKSGPKNW